MPYLGWTVGTLLGGTATNLLPVGVRTALGIAIYGMFIAIIIPPAKESLPVAKVILIAVVLSCIFKLTPGLNLLSSGWVIIICAVIASAYAALRYPVDDAEVQTCRRARSAFRQR